MTAIGRREFLGGSFATVALAALAGCSGGATGGAAGGATVETMWWGAGDIMERTKAALTAFEEANQGVTVTSQFQSFPHYWERLTTLVASKSLPDLVEMNTLNIASYARNGQLADLSSLVSDADLEGFDQGQLAQGTVDGTLVGLSLGGNIQAMLYNQTAVTDSGGGMVPDDLTWDSFATFTGKLAKKLPSGMYAVDDGSSLFGTFEVWVRQRHDEAWTDDGKLAFTEQDVADWFRYWADLRTAGILVPPEVVAEAKQVGTNAAAPLATGKAVFALNWTNLIGQFQTLMDDTVALARVPQGDGQAGDWAHASVLASIAANSEVAQETANLITFLLTDTASLETLGVQRGVPVAAAARAELKDMGLPEHDVAQLDFYDQLLPLTRDKSVQEPSTANDVDGAFIRAAQSVTLGDTAPQAAAAAFFDEANEAVSA
ncbi:ABC transporter substrate-binding protein [Isoptericola sp. BMS4]|uniref:ABC transporter substrate-binding protein n=1 Tax=Isoptericola sp. BMS4 TaxID=2527875 RepID=UPI001423F8E7|nr:extracellular solute-binding protein [Isoptericola sp. BMS4]